jgi:hypothetical protein
MGCGDLCTMQHSVPIMNTKARFAICRNWALAALILTSDADAQETVVSTPEPVLTAPILRENTTLTLSAPSESTDAFFQFGPLSLHPHLLARAIYGIGLPAPGGRHVSSMIYTMAPGLQMDLGQSWSLDYTPTWTTYTARALKDTIGHSASFSGAWMMQEWAVQVSESYGQSSPLLIETGGQTPQRTWDTQLGATRNFGSGMAFQTLASLNERYGDSFPDTRDWATMNWLTLRFTPHFETGLGLGAGYSDIIGEPDATNERYMARIRWNPTFKLSLVIDAGLESRHSRAAEAVDQKNPTYKAALMYRPFDVTQISLGASNAVNTSYYQSQLTERNGWNLKIQQRLFESLYLSATYNHQETEFIAVSSAASTIPPIDTSNPAIVSLPGRSDEVAAFSLRVYTILLKQWRIAATFAHSKNISSQSGFIHNSTQYGFELRRRF